MSGHRPWREVKAEKERRDRERGRTPARSHQHEPSEPCDETCHELADRFIYTRGPHEGQLSDGEHVCVPECYEDQSAALENATWVDPLATTNLVQATSIEVDDPGGRAHKSVELRLLVHPAIDVEDLKLRLVAAVLRVDLELHDARSTP